MNALTIKGLTKTYAGGLQALKGIDLEVSEGDFFALLGKNGAGKSTTIGIINSLVKKTAGTVKVFNYDIDKDLNLAKSCMGVVHQEINFNPFERVLSILINQAGYYGIKRNIALPRAHRYLQKLGLADKTDTQAISLSGGMKRRLMIARALMNQPRLLILDEPTAGVDIELRYLLWDFLRELNEQGTTIILTTHYLEEAEQLCKDVAIIDNGEIIANAAMNELVNRLQFQTIILDLAQTVTVLPQLKFPAKLIDDLTIEVLAKREVTINSIFTELDTHNIKVIGLRNKTNRLEELFMYLINK